MTDPYRMPAVVETDEQRIKRLRDTYYAMGAVDANAIRRLPSEEQRAWEDRYERARNLYLDACRAYERSRASMTDHPAPPGAGSGQA